MIITADDGSTVVMVGTVYAAIVGGRLRTVEVDRSIAHDITGLDTLIRSLMQARAEILEATA